MNIDAPPFPTRINMVPAPCGGGKTYATCRYIKKQKDRSNWMYVAPSIQLLEQTKKELESLGLRVDLLTSENRPGEVVKAITRFLRNCDDSGHILLITWASYQNIRNFNRHSNWFIFVDEIPQVDRFFEINLQQHMDELLKHIKLGDSVNEMLGVVVPADEGKLRRLLEKPDDYTKVLLPFFSAVLSPNNDVFVDLALWSKIAEKQKFDKERNSNRIHFLSMLNPRLFDRVTLLGANIEDSILHRWFNQYYGVRFVLKKSIASGLRYDKHPSAAGRLRIQYLLRDKGYSKYLANKTLGDSGHRWIDAMDKAALKAIDGRKFIYAVNNDYVGLLSDAEHGTKIPTISHGMNCYQHHNLIYFSPSLNRSPQHLGLLNKLGIDALTIKNSTINEVAYQALMRTSLRDIESKEVVECIVIEAATATHLAAHFSEVQIKWIGDERFEKKKAMSGSERNKKYRAKKRRSAREVPLIGDKSLIGTIKDNRHDNTAKPGECQPCPPMYSVTFHADIYTKKASGFHVRHYTPQEFVREMRGCSKDIADNKTDNFMINSTVFTKRSDIAGLRTQDNFDRSSFMMLDFDNGELSIDDFCRIFWKEPGRGNKRSFFIFNSFSRSSEQPNRFRVCLMYKEPANSIEAHQAVFDSVVERLLSNGYCEEATQLDRACRTGNQSFYMPVTNANQKDWYYFKAHGCNTRDIERYGIVPSNYLRTAITNPARGAVLCNINDAKKPMSKMTIKEWKAEIRAMSDGRRRKLFDFGLCLATQFKLSPSDVLDHLLDVAGSEQGMIDKAHGVLESLHSSKHFQKVA